jgi:predicted nucleic acid-binding protein
MNVFVDTSALLALLDREDQRHPHAARTFKTLFESRELVTHNYVQAEAIAVVDRRLGLEARAVLIDELLPAITTIWVDERLHRLAIAAHRAAGRGSSFVDQVSFEFMRQRGLTDAFAFDADFAAAGFIYPLVRAQREEGRRLSEAPGRYGAAAGQDDLVSVAEIAARAGRPTNTVQSWRRRHADFPAPLVNLAAGPVWEWPDVARWIAGRRGGAARTAREPGLLRGRVHMSPDFDAPIPELLDAFEGNP